MYDNKVGSRWVEIMADQLTDGVITLEELRDFDEEVQNDIIVQRFTFHFRFINY